MRISREVEINGKLFLVSIPEFGGNVTIKGETFSATLRHLEILQSLAEGKGAEGTAKALNISTETVTSLIGDMKDVHRGLLGRKIKTIEMVLEAQRLELLSPIALIGLRRIGAELDAKRKSNKWIVSKDLG